MAVAIAIYARESLRGVALPLASAISEDTKVVELVGAAKRFRELVGEELAKELDRVLDEALANEVYRALNSDDLEREFPELVVRFWARISLPLIELNTRLSRAPGAAELVKGVELDLGKVLAKVIRGSGYRYAENLVYALSVLIDRDVWVLDKVSRYGVEAVAKRLTERGLEPLLNLTGYTMYLTFAWVSATAAVLGLVKEFREGNRDVLAMWCREYAKEVESYIDTLDLLLDDEVYTDLVELGVVKR